MSVPVMMLFADAIKIGGVGAVSKSKFSGKQVHWRDETHTHTYTYKHNDNDGKRLECHCWQATSVEEEKKKLITFLKRSLFILAPETSSPRISLLRIIQQEKDRERERAAQRWERCDANVEALHDCRRVHTGITAHCMRCGAHGGVVLCCSCRDVRECTVHTTTRTFRPNACNLSASFHLSYRRHGLLSFVRQTLARQRYAMRQLNNLSFSHNSSSNAECFPSLSKHHLSNETFIHHSFSSLRCHPLYHQIQE